MIKRWTAQYRIGISRVFFVLLVLLCILTSPKFAENTIYVTILQRTGFVLLVVATLGRLWSSLFLCGYENRTVVDMGPFSIVRNPLYLFSLLGATSIGLATASLLITGLFVLFFALLYPLVISNEEDNLQRLLGEPYTKYKQITPRLWPDFSLYRQSDDYTINTRQVNAAFLDVIWFYLARIIHEITKSFRIPFVRSESHSVGNTVCIPLLRGIRYEQRVW